MNESPPPNTDQPGRLLDNMWLLAIGAVLMWLIYFAVAYPPGGAPFVYAEF